MIYTLHIDGEHLNVIAEALDLLPYGCVKPVVAALEPQVNAQNAAWAAANPPKPSSPAGTT